MGSSEVNTRGGSLVFVIFTVWEDHLNASTDKVKYYFAFCCSLSEFSNIISFFFEFMNFSAAMSPMF